MNRRGVSPLLATLMLIAFSALLGAGVMSFGKSYIEERAEFVGNVPSASCEGTSLRFILIDNAPQICTDGQTLKAFVEAAPNEGVDAAQVRIIGANDIHEEDITLNMAKGTSKRLSVAFGDIGAIQQVKITPFRGSGSSRAFCDALTATPDAC